MKAGRSIAVVLAWFNRSPFSGEKLDTVEGLKASGNIARARTALFLMTTARRPTCAGPGGDNDTLRAHLACTKFAAHPCRMKHGCIFHRKYERLFRICCTMVSSPEVRGGIFRKSAPGGALYLLAARCLRSAAVGYQAPRIIAFRNPAGPAGRVPAAGSVVANATGPGEGSPRFLARTRIAMRHLGGKS